MRQTGKSLMFSPIYSYFQRHHSKLYYLSWFEQFLDNMKCHLNVSFYYFMASKKENYLFFIIIFI